MVSCITSWPRTGEWFIVRALLWTSPLSSITKSAAACSSPLEAFIIFSSLLISMSFWRLEILVTNNDKCLTRVG
ncbi:hypothetical protein BGZ60DRAFT_422276 [Tricladium varicosporioides]|nr:hypothetical protein BGZ60DRAFT_422276 [Hymenoscyphus varicosporioides]